MVVEASVISFEVAIDEPIESFTEERKSAVRARLADELSCFTPACHIRIDIIPGSLGMIIRVVIVDAYDSGGAFTLSAVDIVTALLAAQSLGVPRLEIVLGASLISSSNLPSIERNVAAVVVVGLIVPSPPPSPPSQAALLSVPIGIIGIIGAGAGGAVVFVGFVLLIIHCRRRSIAAFPIPSGGATVMGVHVVPELEAVTMVSLKRCGAKGGSSAHNAEESPAELKAVDIDE